MIALLQIAAALYLAAGAAAGMGLSLGARRAVRAGLILLAAGAVVQAGSLVALHAMEPTPPLTSLPVAVSLMTWMLVGAFLAFARSRRLGALVVAIGPIAFLGAFFAALRIPHAPEQELMGASGSLPHVHVLLAAAGLALLAVAAIAGAVFLVENRRLKRRRLQPSRREMGWPSLEALDRVSSAALAVGFPLLTLGFLTGMLWLYGDGRGLWTGSAHEAWTAIAWAISGVLVVARFLAHQGARDAAASAVVGFAFFLFAVVGVGVLE